ncbi:MAG: single-stranded DNA-binding protein [Muribaculaceae bacterium]|nr:single-stranded DNA-binding protein [Muribaculaceae bacterium]
MSVNKVILLGNVGRDPDVRYPSQGQIVASFPLATSDRGYTTSSGTQVPERTEWHNIVMWGRNAEVAEKYIKKGTRLFVEGRLRTRNWEDKNKMKRYITEIYVDSFEMLGGGQSGPKSGGDAPATNENAEQKPVQPAQTEVQNNTTAEGDVIPF